MDYEYHHDDGLINLDEVAFEGIANQAITTRMQEPPDTLSIVYQLKNSRGHFIHVAPSQLVSCALSVRGLVSCQGQGDFHRTCRPWDRNANLDIWSVYGKNMPCYQTPNDLTLYAIWALTDLLDQKYYVRWTDECVQGTLQRAIAEIETSKIIVVVSSYLEIYSRPC